MADTSVGSIPIAAIYCAFASFCFPCFSSTRPRVTCISASVGARFMALARTSTAFSNWPSCSRAIPSSFAARTSFGKAVSMDPSWSRYAWRLPRVWYIAASRCEASQSPGMDLTRLTCWTTAASRWSLRHNASIKPIRARISSGRSDNAALNVCAAFVNSGAAG